MRFLRLIATVLVAAFGAWIARLLAHSKLPQPEGRWREIAPDDLGTRR